MGDFVSVQTRLRRDILTGKWHSLQVNCLSMPLLSLLLLPHMVRTAREHSTTPRIVVVASEVHYMASIEKRVAESPEILATLGSAEYCTPKYVLSFRRTRPI